MKISKHFSLKELTKSGTAQRLGIDNMPSNDIIDSLTMVADNILEPVREHFGKPFVPNSGYRSLLLNRALKSRDTSQHIMGEAVDIEVPGVSNYDLAVWIRDNLEFDKVILEFYKSGEPTSGWVHVTFREEDNRKETYTISGGGTKTGLIE